MEENDRTKENETKQDRFTHDKFVYFMWSNVKYARRFFRQFLPKQILDAVDLNDIELIPTRRVDERGDEHIGDIFYKIGLKNGKHMTFVVILEHKSQYERHAAVQLLRYEAWTIDYMAQNPELFRDDDGLLPTPFSILLCQDERPQLDRLLRRIEGVEYGPRTTFHSVNFQSVDLESIRSDPLLFATMGLSKFTREDNKENRTPELLEYFGALLHDVEEEDFSLFAQRGAAFLNYTQWVMRKRIFLLENLKRALSSRRKNEAN